jgi:hypothetical protein
MVVDTSGSEKWENNIRRATNLPDAEVHLVREEEWKGPKLQSVSEGATSCIKGIDKYFRAHGLPRMSRNDFEREHMGDMANPMTGLLVVLVRRPLT